MTTIIDECESFFRFIVACKDGDLKTINRLYKKGFNIHDNNEDGLKCAVRFGREKVFWFIVKRGGNIHVQNGILLYEAFEYCRHNMIKLLVDNHIEFNPNTDILNKIPKIGIWLSRPKNINEYNSALYVIENLKQFKELYR